MEDGHSPASAEIRTAQLTDDAAHRSGRNWPGFVKFVLGLGAGAGAGHWTLGNDAGEMTSGPSSARPTTSRARAKHGWALVCTSDGEAHTAKRSERHRSLVAV